MTLAEAERLVYDHGDGGESGSFHVTITFDPEGDKTRVRLVHRGLPADAVEDHGRGWAHWLEQLAIAATGGDARPDAVPAQR
jgi:hypothetical protein